MIPVPALLIPAFLYSASSPSADPDYTTVWRSVDRRGGKRLLVLRP